MTTLLEVCSVEQISSLEVAAAALAVVRQPMRLRRSAATIVVQGAVDTKLNQALLIIVSKTVVVLSFTYVIFGGEEESLNVKEISCPLRCKLLRGKKSSPLWVKLHTLLLC